MTLEATLTVDAGGRSVVFEMTVQNGGDRTVELIFPSSKVADLVVTDDGEEVWRWSDGRMFTQAIETANLAPGESFTSEFVWDAPEPGAYEARATLDARETDATAKQPFTVTS